VAAKVKIVLFAATIAVIVALPYFHMFAFVVGIAAVMAFAWASCRLEFLYALPLAVFHMSEHNFVPVRDDK
jgi:hypothetical protein